MDDLAQDVRAYLDRLEATQSEFTRLSARKRSALRKADAAAILSLADAEADVAARLHGHVVDRQRLLERAHGAGIPCRTIEELVDRLGHATAPRLRERVSRARKSSGRLQREAWVHWIVARRAESHHRQLCDLIANDGRNSPTYDTPTTLLAGVPTSGGAVLDASA